ncbi:MAG: OmpA family protein [Myxococcota bacterium]
MVLVWLMGSGFVGSARADGLSSDIELMQPGVAPQTPLGMRGIRAGAPQPASFGLSAWAAQRPLMLIDEDGLGTVLAGRQTAAIVAAVPLGRATSAQFSLPAVLQQPGDVPDLAVEGFAIGDLQGELQAKFPSRIPLAVHLGFGIPTGAPDAWVGEGAFRLEGGARAAVPVRRTRLLGEASIIGTLGNDGAARLSRGAQFRLNAGAWHPLTQRLALNGALLSRLVVPSSWSEGAVAAVEVLGGVQLNHQRPLRFDLSVGTGLNNGAGTSRLRVAAGVTWQPEPRTPAALPVVETPPPPDIMVTVDEDAFLEELTESPDVDVPIAQLTGDRITLSQTIHFDQGTAKLRPSAAPIIAAVADIINTTPRIAGVVIEGHTSGEGSFEYNFELSTKRALAVYQALVLAGVNPERLSFRGMGEVRPQDAVRAENRRVAFLVSMTAPGDTPSLARETIALPWSGQSQVVYSPEVAAPDVDDSLDPEIFNDEEEP